MIKFKGEIFYWRGPAPYLFVAVPEKPSRDLKAISAMGHLWLGSNPSPRADWQNREVGHNVVIQIEINCLSTNKVGMRGGKIRGWGSYTGGGSSDKVLFF